jgi:hypothetical protein
MCIDVPAVLLETRRTVAAKAFRKGIGGGAFVRQSPLAEAMAQGWHKACSGRTRRMIRGRATDACTDGIGTCPASLYMLGRALLPENAMPLKIAIQMDHIAKAAIAGDTTFALSLEAQRRGHSLYHYTPDRLSMLDGKVFARVEEMTVRDEQGNHFTLGEPVRTDLSEMDVVLLRQDPPFDMNYITTTHILERIHPKTLVVNDPAWVRNSPEKIFVTEFAGLMPETLITKDPLEVAAFRKAHGDIIVKPLYGNGGAGVFHLH